jgi:hypothetical protein
MPRKNVAMNASKAKINAAMDIQALRICVVDCFFLFFISAISEFRPRLCP